MCLVNVKPDDDDDDIVVAPRRASRRNVVWSDPASSSRTRVSERIVTTHAHASPPTRLITYSAAAATASPRTSGALVRSVTPPRNGQRETIEVVSVDVAETRNSRAGGSTTASPRGSRVSVVRSGSKSRSRRGGMEEVYIERERERVRLPERKDEYDTYRYVEAPREQRSSRSITYETNPRLSGRLVERERERVVVEDKGRRREYYRRP